MVHFACPVGTFRVPIIGLSGQILGPKYVSIVQVTRIVLHQQGTVGHTLTVLMVTLYVLPDVPMVHLVNQKYYIHAKSVTGMFRAPFSGGEWKEQRSLASKYYRLKPGRLSP